MPRPSKISDEMRTEILEVARKRKEFRGLPTTKELARKANCSPRTVQDVMYGRNVREPEVMLADPLADKTLPGD